MMKAEQNGSETLYFSNFLIKVFMGSAVDCIIINYLIHLLNELSLEKGKRIIHLQFSFVLYSAN